MWWEIVTLRYGFNCDIKLAWLSHVNHSGLFTLNVTPCSGISTKAWPLGTKPWQKEFKFLCDSVSGTYKEFNLHRRVWNWEHIVFNISTQKQKIPDRINIWRFNSDVTATTPRTCKANRWLDKNWGGKPGRTWGTETGETNVMKMQEEMRFLVLNHQFHLHRNKTVSKYQKRQFKTKVCSLPFTTAVVSSGRLIHYWSYVLCTCQF